MPGGPDRMSDDQWLTPAEAARVLGLTARTVHRMLRDGELPAERRRRSYRIRRSDVDAFVTTSKIERGAVHRRIVRRAQSSDVGRGEPLNHMTATEVADLLQVTMRSALRLIHSGELPAERQGRAWLVARADVNAYIDSLKVKPGDLSHLRKK